MSLDVVVFIDAQNVYRSARREFAPQSTYHVAGQFDPIALGEMLAKRSDRVRALQEVRVYTGRPDASRDPVAHAAHMRQTERWGRSGVTVVPRPLRYRQGRAEEKGVDVALSVDLISMAIEGKFDVGIVFSADTDFQPALEYVVERCPTPCQIEVAAWRGPGKKHAPRLSLKNSRVWCHWLSEQDYQLVHDATDYASP